MQLPAVELQANDGKHEDGKEEQQADLEEGNHGLHDGLQHNLQTWGSRVYQMMILETANNNLKLLQAKSLIA